MPTIYCHKMMRVQPCALNLVKKSQLKYRINKHGHSKLTNSISLEKTQTNLRICTGVAKRVAKVLRKRPAVFGKDCKHWIRCTTQLVTLLQNTCQDPSGECCAVVRHQDVNRLYCTISNTHKNIRQMNTVTLSNQCSEIRIHPF